MPPLVLSRPLRALGLALVLPFLTLTPPSPASAQAEPAGRAGFPLLQGRTLAGQPFSLEALRGKVTLVVFWSTDCAVCRDKMPELRANAQGWRGRPFELVTVSLDRKLKDAADYEQLVRTMVSGREQLPTLWAGDASYRFSLPRPTHLPATYLLDKAGRVVAQYDGRIPPEAWDRIADLL